MMNFFKKKKSNGYVPPQSVVELQEIISKDEKWQRKVKFQHDKRLMPMMRETDKPLTQEQIDDIYKFWDEKTNGVYRPDLTWYQFYYSRTGIEDPRFIDNTLQYYYFIDKYNNTKYNTFKDKNYLNKFFPEIHQAKTIAMNIMGHFYDAEYNIIDKEEFIALCIAYEKEFVIKPSYGSSGGEGVVFVPTGVNRIELEEILAGYSGNYIVQEAIRQHETLSKISPDSINTIRLLTYMIGDKVVPVSAVLRMGRGGSRVDNMHFGGIACGIDKDGKCTKYALDSEGNLLDRHPDSKCEFLGQKIPSYEKALALAEDMHKKLPMFGNIGWDITIDENGEPLLIEFNTWYTQLALHQVSNGPVYGEYFDDILDMILKKAHIDFEKEDFSVWAYKDRCQIKNIHSVDKKIVTVPSNIVGRPVTSIMKNAAKGNCEIKELSATDIKRIGIGAFKGCKNLEKVIVGSNLKDIGKGAFENCDKLTIYGPKNSYVEEYANKNNIAFERI